MITVLVSVRNGEAYLREALESVLTQTLREFELLVVDNGSTDGTPQILASLDDPRLRVLRQDPGLSLGGALNRGLQEARYELVARMDADDVCLPRRLERQLSYLQNHPEVAILGTSYEIFGPHVERKWVVHAITHPLELAWHYTWESCLGHPTVMYRKSLILAAGGYPEGSAQDLVLFSRLSQQHRCTNLSEVLLRYRWHGQNMSVVEKPEAQREIEAAFRANLPLAEALKGPYLDFHQRRPGSRSWEMLRANHLVIQTLAHKLGYSGLQARLYLQLIRKFTSSRRAR